MAARSLKWFATLFGGVCMAIAIGHIAVGPQVIPGGVPVNATMDSEDRFYATLFFGFGAALVWAAQDLAVRRSFFLVLLAVFFLGGVSRIVSMLQVGFPHPLFVFLTGVELTLPVGLAHWLNAAHPKSGRGTS